MGKKDDLSDFTCGIVVGDRQAGSISEPADLPGSSHTNISSLQRIV